jgi:RHS repeat-associated protein
VLSTYYVYDDLGNLAFVLSPSANGDADVAISVTTLNNLCYQYRYDQRNRLTQKKVPGKGWEFTVYNTLDQVVMTQDANQRAQSTQQWTFNKYDIQGRDVVSGLYLDAGTTGDLNPNAPSTTRLTYFSGLYTGTSTPKWESWTGTTTSGYDGSSLPTGQTYANLLINFYDKYPGTAYIPSVYGAPSGASVINTGLPTGSMTNVLGTATMLVTANYYDGFGRVIKVYRQHYLGAVASPNNYDAIATTYNFVSQPTSVTRQHWTSATASYPLVTVANTYYYDHMGRKRSAWEQITNGNSSPTTKTLVSKTDYNEIGQMLTKHLHSTVDTVNSTGYMQNIAYTYNERGWLLGASSPLFAVNYYYNTLANKAWNGNIRYQYWGVPGNESNRYAYNYDMLNRVTAGTGLTGNTEYTSYDQNGNIAGMSRYKLGTLIDNMAYVYLNGGNPTNQVQTINDATSSDLGMVHGLTSFTYDGNGNLLNQINITNAQNKTFTYNLLNLPQSVTVPTGTVTYTYDASGQKLRKVAVINSVTTTTEYIAGIQYKNSTTAIDFIQTAEGKAVPNGTGYDYTYYIGDNLGNTRVTFDTKNGSAQAQQITNYYPYGLEIDSTVSSPKNDYLYNKKELQDEFGEYDYGARLYDPVIGRWSVVDPLAASYPSFSPYTYAYDNPLRYIDALGLGPGDRVRAARKLLNIDYLQQQGNYLRTGSGGGPYQFMDCSEFVCRVMAADGITDRVENMPTATLAQYLSSSKFIHSMTPQVGDIALWEGHTGIVSAIGKDGKIKLLHEPHKGAKSKENPNFAAPEVYHPGGAFLGYYRPAVETKDGKNLSSVSQTKGSGGQLDDSGDGSIDLTEEMKKRLDRSFGKYFPLPDLNFPNPMPPNPFDPSFKPYNPNPINPNDPTIHPGPDPHKKKDYQKDDNYEY